MTASRTFGTQMRRRARALYDQGYGCNAIARELGFSPSTVSEWAKREGLAFDRSQTDIAVRAHVTDLREMQTLLAKKAAVAASDLLDQLDGTYLVWSFGGKDNTYEEHTLDRPPVEVVRSTVVTAGIAIDKASKVLDQSDRDLSAVDAWLEHMTGVANG